MRVKHGAVVFNKLMITAFTVVLSVACLFTGARAEEPDPRDNLYALELPTLSGEVTVYYSDGFEERAKYFQDMGEAAQKYFTQPEILGVKVDLAMAVLGPEDWAKLTKLPYGMQHFIEGTTPTAVLAASSDNMLVNGFLAGKDFVPEEILARLEKLGFSYEEAAATMVDLIGFHEIGHIYADAYGIVTWPAIKWLGEYVATYLAYSFMMENRPNLAGVWDVMTEVNASTPGMKHTTIADFEKLYIGVGGPNYGWYQGLFNQHAAEVYEKMGISFMRGLKKSLAKTPKPTEKDPYYLKEMAAIYEGFGAWAKGPEGNLK